MLSIPDLLQSLTSNAQVTHSRNNCWFHYGSNITDDPGNAIFQSSIRMQNGVATDFDVSSKDKIEKEPFGDMIDMVCYGLVRNATV